MRPWGVRRLFRFPSRTRDEVRRDIREEFQFHLDMRVEALVRAGMSEAAARARALGEFGDPQIGGRACARHGDRVERRRRLARWAGELRQDTTIGLRLLARSPGFAAVAVLTLALGIGATATIFSALDAVLLRPLPYPEPARLVQVFETLENGSLNSVSGGVFRDWREHRTGFDHLTLVNRVTGNLRERDGAERLRGLEVSHGFLDVFGIRMLRGRGFGPEHDASGGQNDVMILTEDLWRSRFGGRDSILGARLTLDEVPRTVIGIIPAGSWWYDEDQFIIPAVLSPGTDRASRSSHWAEVYGRLAPGTTLPQADADLKALRRQLVADYPTYKQQWNVAVRPLHEQRSGDRRPLLLMLAGAVALVLLIACANVANLLLARACQRQQEIALRSALGATGQRIVRQVLTESLLLAVLGGIGGVLLSLWGVGLLQQLAVDVFPGAMTPRLDLRVLGFALLITGVTGLSFGILPAWRAYRPDVNDTLKNGGRSATAGGRHRTQSALVIAEIALTVVLLAGAGLLLRSLANAASVDPGFEPGPVLAFDLSLPAVRYETAEARLAFSRELLRRLRAIPGVEAAGAGMAVPFSGAGYGEYLSRPDRPEPRDRLTGRVDFVSGGYFEALGTRLLAGRWLTDADNRLNGPRVVVVNETLVETLFPGEKPVGRSLTIYGEPWEIVGVIANVVDQRADRTRRPFAYLPQAFNPFDFSIAMRTALDPLSLVRAARSELRRLDPGVPLANARTLDRAMADSMAQRRIVVSVIGAFAAAALALACIGLYGVMAYSVATRQRELCIRLALGAAGGQVVRHVLGDGLRLTGAGLIAGVIGALGAARLLASQLYQVRSTDPIVMTAATVTVAAVAFVACWLPAWRATRFNPIAALRND